MKKETQYPIIDTWAKQEIKRARIAALTIGTLLIIILLYATL